MTKKSLANQQFRDKTKLWLLDYRASHSCEECGESHIACLSFHHKDPSTKKYKIAEMPNRGCSIKLILKEIAKCRILCHNCHAKLHYAEEVRPCVLRQQTVGIA